MTLHLSHLLRADTSTLDQYEILQRADRLFPVRRYYGGPLTEEEVKVLIANLRSVKL